MATKTAKKTATKKTVAKKTTKKAKVEIEQPQAQIVQNNPETKLAEIATDLSGLEKKAVKITINNSDDVIKATEFLTSIKTRIKRIEEIRKFFVDPLNQQVKRINDLFRTPADKYKSMETQVKRLIADYTLEQEKIRREQEAKLQAQHQKEIEKAEKQGKEVEFAMTPTIEKPEQTVKADGGSATTRTVWKFNVVYISDLIRQANTNSALQKFLMVDEKAVRQAIAEGAREIPGIKIYEDIEVSVRTN